MFLADPKTLARVAPTIRRVVVADPHAASARLLTEVLKSMGAREVITAADQDEVLIMIREIEPGLVITERLGPRLDGEDLTRRLRRSATNSRKVPVIMATADATARTILAARDAGVHEFLRKPFAAADLFRRVETVATRPRDWIEAEAYVGPDRRRFNAGAYAGLRKRDADAVTDPGVANPSADFDTAIRRLSDAVERFAEDPRAATQQCRDQAVAIEGLAIEYGDHAMARAATQLTALLSGPVRLGPLQGSVRQILALRAPSDVAAAG